MPFPRLAPRDRLCLMAGILLSLGALVFGAVLARREYVHWRVESFRSQAEKYGELFAVDPEMILSVISAESSGDPRAQSAASARGLMQVTPITLEEVRRRSATLGEGDLFDPEYNIAVGSRYLASLMERFHGDKAAVIAAYHMGPTAVARALAARPGSRGLAMLGTPAVGPKTRAYVLRVLAEWEDRRAKRDAVQREKEEAMRGRQRP